jgi:hypothetical protein
VRLYVPLCKINQDQQLASLPLNTGEEAADEVESRLWHYAPKRWKKYPDAPLQEIVRSKQERRARVEACGGRRARLKKESDSA